MLMKGVILFADNKVLEKSTVENKLFEKLNGSSDYVVLPITSVNALEETLKNISTFKALILDWNFERDGKEEEELLGIKLPDINPDSLLLKTELYSLIYVYSQNEIPEASKDILSQKFGGKITFKAKGKGDNIEEDANSIIRDIESFENDNKHMKIPFIWSQAINKSVQEIFVELEQADPNWIKEIRDTATNDGAEPTSEVIDIFHHILNESLIQNKLLREALNAYQCDAAAIAEENTAKLYRRFFYSKLHEDAPLMTGDIFKFSDEDYGVLITPECDLSNKDKVVCEFLMIKKSISCAYQNKKRKSYAKDPSSADGIFHNSAISQHYLFSFPFDAKQFDCLAVVDFRNAMMVCERVDKDGNSISIYRNGYKLNSPYLHQMRQRYVAYIGRYGVPAIPVSLRNYILKKTEK